MPIYSDLQITPSFTEPAIARIKWIAGNLLRLRRDLHEHFQARESQEATARDQPAGPESAFLAPGAFEMGPSAAPGATLRLATWNIREFDSDKYGKRLEESLHYIAEILAHFDLIAVQEVREDRRALEEVMRLLGPNWQYVVTDVTEGSAGNRERMAFVYDTNKIRFGFVAGEVMLPSDRRGETLHAAGPISLVLPSPGPIVLRDDTRTKHRAGKERLDEEVRILLEGDTEIVLPEGTRLVLPRLTQIQRDGAGRIVLPTDLPLQDVLFQLPEKSLVAEKLDFARSPFLVTFQAGWLTLNLCTVHIYYGEGEPGLRRRKAEIWRLIDFLAERAQNENDSDANSFFVVLGDFNIVDREHETMQALIRHGFRVPEQLQSLPGTNVAKDKFYDQIAYWLRPDTQDGPPQQVTKIEALRANVFDYFETVFRDQPEGASPGREDLAYYLEHAASLQEPVARAIARKEQRLNRALTAAESSEVTREVYLDWRTYQMSDHLPMWIELRIDFGNEYLQSIVES
jgi:endonuclease/exonuclease/phosphatase family metal-dependent hydrolase